MAIVTTNDYNRLIELLGFDGPKSSSSENGNVLYQKLLDAKKMSAERIEKNVITMNSRVLLRDIQSGRQSELTLTYPKLAVHRDRLISVLSPVGLTLLGRKESEKVSWNTPAGIGFFEIVKVTYQPEAAGHYYL
jgi:regulator of nucleoside diphosphate kinase